MINNLSFKMLLENDSSVSMIKYLISHKKNCHLYNLRLISRFSRPLVRSVFHWTESISYPDPVIWNIFSDRHKNLSNYSVFKSLKIAPADFAKHTFLESALHRLSLLR